MRLQNENIYDKIITYLFRDEVHSAARERPYLFRRQAMKKLSNGYLSAFCLELGYILRSGMPMGNGLALLRDDDDSADSRALLERMCELVDTGAPLSEALAESGRFPDYMLRMTELAERTGRMEPTLMALSKYYEQQRLFRLSVKQALLYPVMLLAVFLVVILVLVTQVLPIFDNVFRQLGSTLSPMAQALMNMGMSLSGASTIIALVIGIIALIGVAVSLIPGLRDKFWGFIYRNFGGSGVWGELLRARFASALSIAIASGLGANESIDSASALIRGSKKMDARVERCRELLGTEGRLATALSESGIFSARNSRMIAMGFETGSIDEVMGEISVRSENAAQERLGALVSAIEPTIVIISSLVAGAILLSVMLPLVSIMSGIS